mgnify:CR=1 FL=1
MIEKAGAARGAARHLASLSTAVKNRALRRVAQALRERQADVMAANEADCVEARAAGMDPAMYDRLLLTAQRLEGIASDVEAVAALPDPVGEVFDMRTLPNGLLLGRKRVPIGVIGAIFESRPNVTVDIAVLALKSGNAVVLRGGKEAVRSGGALAALVSAAVVAEGVPQGAVNYIHSTDRAIVGQMARLRGYIDLIVPRGGAGLIRYVSDVATIPVITGGIGVCHTYVDRDADVDKAVKVVLNAKTRRCTICNALDTLLVHEGVAEAFLPRIGAAFAEAGVEMRCCQRSLPVLQGIQTEGGSGASVRPATEDDFGREFLSMVAAIKVVDSLDEAIEHVAVSGSGHAEAIVTENYTAAMRFLNEVDAAADGAQFGLGAEVGISTQKLHARGPMGLKELTTYKWIIFGDGHVRPA